MNRIDTAIEELKAQREYHANSVSQIDQALACLGHKPRSENGNGNGHSRWSGLVKDSIRIDDAIIKALQARGTLHIDELYREVRNLGSHAKRVSVCAASYGLASRGRIRKVDEGTFAIANGSSN